MPRSFAISSFFLLARSDLFFFSVYLLSSRLSWIECQPFDKAIDKKCILITALVDLLIPPLKAPPTIKVVPKVIESLDFRLCRV